MDYFNTISNKKKLNFKFDNIEISMIKIGNTEKIKFQRFKRVLNWTVLFIKITVNDRSSAATRISAVLE